VLARLDQGKVVAARLTPNCGVDAGGVPVVWLTDVRAAESVAWLIHWSARRWTIEGRAKPPRPAITAIGLHATEGAAGQIIRDNQSRHPEAGDVVAPARRAIRAPAFLKKSARPSDLRV
jgi:hypothetical protein